MTRSILICVYQRSSAAKWFCLSDFGDYGDLCEPSSPPLPPPLSSRFINIHQGFIKASSSLINVLHQGPSRPVCARPCSSVANGFAFPIPATTAIPAITCDLYSPPRPSSQFIPTSSQCVPRSSHCDVPTDPSVFSSGYPIFPGVPGALCGEICYQPVNLRGGAPLFFGAFTENKVLCRFRPLGHPTFSTGSPRLIPLGHPAFSWVTQASEPPRYLGPRFTTSLTVSRLSLKLEASS
jgi:hypothetical protein